jgi:uncharacterized protein (TIGR03435 family)
VKTTRCLACCLLLAAPAFAQTKPKPQFEVVSIRPSSEQTAAVQAGLRISGAQARIAAMGLKDYITIAYNVRPQQVIGPDWMSNERFDVAGTIPAGNSPDQVGEMLQAMLTDRFKLAFHREQRDLQVYALTVSRGGLKIKESAPAPPAAADAPAAAVSVAATGGNNGVAIDMGGGASFTLANNKLEVKKLTMEDMAGVLTRFVDHPVVDRTGLKGIYDFTLDLAPEEYMAVLIRSAINAGVSLPPQAVRLLDTAPANPLASPFQNVGLSFDSTRAPLEVIVVDSILRAPTEN